MGILKGPSVEQQEQEQEQEQSQEQQWQHHLLSRRDCNSQQGVMEELKDRARGALAAQVVGTEKLSVTGGGLGTCMNVGVGGMCHF